MYFVSNWLLCCRLEFDNSPYLKFIEMQQMKVEQSLPFKAVTLFEMFPFAILLNSHLEITMVGDSLRKILPNCIGKISNNWIVCTDKKFYKNPFVPL